MAKTYDEYEVDQLAAAKKQTDEYSTQRKTQADEAAKISDSLYDTAISTAEKNYTASAQETESSYRGVYDANAVNELVARRNVEEAMANMGLTDSGLNATQQTAISLQRGRADSQTTQQKQAAVDAIMRELDNVRAQYNAEKTAASADIYAQADADILNFKSNADAAARTNAASLYAADQEAAAAQYAADQEAAAAQADHHIQMLKLGYEWSDEAGGYVKADTETGTSGQLTDAQIKLALEYMDKTGAEYDEAVKVLFGTTSAASAVNQRNAVGTPSYTAISTQAMIYQRSDPERATEYIEREYNLGHISTAQRDELVGKYGVRDGYDYDSVVAFLEHEKSANMDRILKEYGSFEAYAEKYINIAWANGLGDDRVIDLLREYT